MVGLGLQNDRQVLTVLTSIGERLYREEGREGREGGKGISAVQEHSQRR